MSCADRFPGKKFLFIHRQLKIMGAHQKFCHPISYRNTAILKHSEQIISRIHQRAEQKVIKIFVGFFGSFFFKGSKSNRVFLGEDDPCCFRTGEGQGYFPHTLEFFDVPWISAAGITEHPGSRFYIHITEIFFI